VSKFYHSATSPIQSFSRRMWKQRILTLLPTCKILYSNTHCVAPMKWWLPTTLPEVFVGVATIPQSG